jgi:hypothetical protein
MRLLELPSGGRRDRDAQQDENEGVGVNKKAWTSQS